MDINQTFPGSTPASPDIGARLLKKYMFISHDPCQVFSVQNERLYFTWSKLTVKNNPSIEKNTWLPMEGGKTRVPGNEVTNQG